MDKNEPGQPSWSARSLGSAFQHHVFYTLIRFGGRKLAHGLLRLVVAWYVLFSPLARKRSSFYLGRRFPGRNPWQRLLDCYRLCLGLGEVLVDRAALGILGPAALNVSLAGCEQLRALGGEGKGLILLMAHVGCWQLGMASLSSLEAPVSLLIHRDQGDVDRHFFEHGQAPSPFRIIDPQGYLGGTLEMLQVLKKGEVLCMMGDRVLGSPASQLAVDFLGGRVQLPFSAYKLASATGAPIAILFPHKSGHDRYVLQVAGILRVPADLGRSAAAYRPYALHYANALEAFVQEHPFQFFNFFDLWTDPS